MRALREIGVLAEFLKRGDAADGLDLFTSAGVKIASLPTPRLAGPDVPAGGAIMRPVLAAILADATRAAGTNVRLGATFRDIADGPDSVSVTFADGSVANYDLVIGADGLYSKTREAIFPNAPKPRFTGQCVWRAVLPRLPEINAPVMWIGDKVKVGANPVSKDEMYIFVTEDRPTNDYVDPARFTEMLRDLLAPFKAPLVKKLHDLVNDYSRIVYRPLEGLLVPPPWSKGRVVLIGDAVHATTPHLASGACIGIEDAIVLAEEIGSADNLASGLKAFQNRRWERCRMVVENSLRLGELEITNGDKGEQADIMRKSMTALAQPI
jgi:2-polyprenyl-6-methoxyphenol hydroxylase-like FAD-dependent oxidoreductase